jgi:8-oxo-dGTP pyrophosphatase MutT (NUDIX family)
LALTKGKIDAGESPLEAANRELIEEIGYGAKKLSFIKTMTLAPGYQSNFMSSTPLPRRELKRRRVGSNSCPRYQIRA